MNRNTRSALKKFFITLIFITIAGYAVFNARLIILGPKIISVTPPSGTTLTDGFIIVTGTTKNLAAINFNDREIFIDEDGIFTESAILYPGLNVFKISGQDKFGKEIQEIVQYVYATDTIPVIPTIATSSIATSSEGDGI